MAQQSHEDQPSLDLIEILNITSENGRELSLNILLEEVLAVDTVKHIAVFGDETGRVFGS